MEENYGNLELRLQQKKRAFNDAKKKKEALDSEIKELQKEIAELERKLRNKR